MGLILKRLQRGKQSFRKRAGDQILNDLRAYLNMAEPQVIRFLHSTWNAQRGAITYQELQQAIINSEVPQAWLDRWQEDYSQMVTTKLVPKWEQGMIAANQQLTQQYPDFVFNVNGHAVRQAVLNRATQLPVELAQAQYTALQGVIRKAAVMGTYTVDELSRVIRPMVGVTQREGVAVMNYYNTLRQEGMSHARAAKQAGNYAARVHRGRAMRIARTELAFAYEEGAFHGVEQAQAQGLIRGVVKRWLTADDERVCPICGPLDNKVVGQYELFDGRYMIPPAHPHCRCAVAYEEDENAPVTISELAMRDQVEMSKAGGVKMAYSATSELPEAVRNVLPEEAQTIFMEAANSALEQDNSKDSGTKTRRATAAGWVAVRNAGYKRGADGKWTKEEGAKEEGTEKMFKTRRFQIQKIGDEDSRLVFGYASVAYDEEGYQLEDYHEDLLEEEDLEYMAYKFVLYFREGGEMHLKGGSAVLVESVVFTLEKQKAMGIEKVIFTDDMEQRTGIKEGMLPVGWWVGFYVTDDQAWEKVKNGDYEMFSIEGSAIREEVFNFGHKIKRAADN